MNVSSESINPYDTRLAAMMRRRHLIVHRTDRNPMIGAGHHPAVSIRKSLVETWTQAVEGFGNDLLARAKPEQSDGLS